MKKKTNMTSVTRVRMTGAEKKELEDAAHRVQLPLSRYVRKILRSQEIIQLPFPHEALSRFYDLKRTLETLDIPKEEKNKLEDEISRILFALLESDGEHSDHS